MTLVWRRVVKSLHKPFYLVSRFICLGWFALHGLAPWLECRVMRNYVELAITSFWQWPFSTFLPVIYFSGLWGHYRDELSYLVWTEYSDHRLLGQSCLLYWSPVYSVKLSLIPPSHARHCLWMGYRVFPHCGGFRSYGLDPCAGISSNWLIASPSCSFPSLLPALFLLLKVFCYQYFVPFWWILLRSPEGHWWACLWIDTLSL